MTHFAIVGGAGFIGSHFVDYLAQRNHTITVVDNFCSGTPSRLQEHANAKYLQIRSLNAEDTNALTDAFESVDVVIHLASNPDIAKAATEPRIDFLQGTALTESVLEASRRAGVSKVLYASGSGVYATSGLDPISEDTLLQPISTYGASKLAGEALVSAYSFMFGITGVSFRFANVVGPRQTHGVGYDFVNKLKANPKSLDVLGDGTQTKSYIYVTDVVEAVMLAYEKCISRYEVYNVSTLDYISVKDIAALAILASNQDLDSVSVTYGDSDRGWKADVPKIFLDSKKIRALGWASKYSSKEAMQLSLQSMVSEFNRRTTNENN